MKLNFKERFVIRSLLPKESNIITQTLVRDILKKIPVLTQKEMKKFGVRIEGNAITWNENIVKKSELDISFTHAEISILKDQINKLDKENKITQDNLSLVLKIKEQKI